MTEKEKMLQGMIYDPNYDPTLIAERLDCKELCHDYNDLRPKDSEGRNSLLHRIFGEIGMMAACPDGDGFKVTFPDFTIKHLPDAVRTKWHKDNAE